MNAMGVCMEKEGVLTMNCKETKENGVGMMEYPFAAAGLLCGGAGFMLQLPHPLSVCLCTTSRSDIIRFPFVER